MYEKNLRKLIKQVSDNGKAKVVKSEHNDISAIKHWEHDNGNLGFLKLDTNGDIFFDASIHYATRELRSVGDSITLKQLKLAIKLLKIDFDISVGFGAGEKCNRQIEEGLCSGKMDINDDMEAYCPICNNWDGHSDDVHDELYDYNLEQGRLNDAANYNFR